MNIVEKTIEDFKKYYDKLTIVLLDKDNILPKCPPPTDIDYWIKKPTKEQYHANCNNFWWCLNNVAKSITRDELSYAMWMYNVIIREPLDKMIEWHIGINNNFTLSAGKQGKLFKKYMSSELYSMYEETFSNSEYENMWKSIFKACELFHILALHVGEHFKFEYNMDEENGIIEYLKWIKKLKGNIYE